MQATSLILPILVAAFVPLAQRQSAQSQTAPPLPAAFYDVDVREQLGFADDGAAATNAGVRISGSSRAPSGAPLNAQTRFAFGEFNGASRFIIDADSLLFRNGPNEVAIAINSFIAVEEIRRPARNAATWVKITYRARDEARQLFVRRTGTRHQDQILAALRLAIERDAAARRSERR